MSLTKAQFKETAKSIGAVLLTATFMMPAANAQNLSYIEPSSTDLSKPITNACVKTTEGQPNLTAWDKLKVIMSARGQMIAASGDQIVQGTARPEKIFTISNNFSGKEGYIIDSSTNKNNRENANSFCFTYVANAAFVDVSKNSGVPAVLNKGELGIVLANNDNIGSKVAVMGMYSQGSLYAVHFNPNTHKAVYKGADGSGDRARDLAALENFDYSPKLKTVMEQLSSAKKDSQVAIFIPKNQPQ